METLKKTRGRYLMVLVAMAGLVSSSLGIMTNAGGIFFTPIAGELGQSTAAVNLTLTIRADNSTSQPVLVLKENVFLLIFLI